MSEKNTETKKTSVKPLITAGSVIAVILLLFVIAAVALSGEGIAKGISVEGKSVSGMSVKSATTFIDEKISKEVPEGNVKVTFGGNDYDIAFVDVIMGFDAAKTAQIAYDMGRDGNLISNTFNKIGFLIKGVDLPLEPIVNEEYVGQFINTICETLEKVKTDDYYFMEGDKLKLVFGTSGDYIDTESFREQLDNLMRSGKSGEIILEAVPADPKPFDVNEIYENIAKEPSNTYYEEIDGKKYIKYASNGYDFDKSKLKKAIEENKGVNESFYFLPTVIKPEKTELDETGLFTEVLAKYTSKITDQNKNRLTNVHLAASKINGAIINPGDVFAYLKYVEPINVEGGYKTAKVYSNGKIEEDIGGGVCQVSSALYSAVLNANLEIVKRYAHSLTVGYVPLGQDATVSSGEGDFRFRNNTNEPIKVVADSDNAGVYITILGKKLDPSITVEIENVTTQTFVPEVIVTEDATLKPGEEVVDYAGKTGYVVQTYKHIYKNGELVETV
ncbi:MAG: VanW family protein, partial [Monoglobales bacterium]